MANSALAEGAKGGKVTLIGQLGKVAVQLASVIVLSRLLSPDDFGLIAMVTVVSALGDLLRDFGLSTAGLQARKLSEHQASNLFWANTVLGFTAAVLMAVSTPLLVWFYHEPRLWTITPVLAISLLLNGLQSQMQVRLSRNHQYAALAFSDLGSQAIALSVAILAALLGWGYWALVVQTVTAVLALLVIRAAASKWRPLAPKRGVGSRGLLVSGADFGVAQFLQFAASNTDTVAIGALWGSVPLGYYNRAFQLLSQPVGRLLAPLMNVVIPTINAARELGEDIKGHYLRIQGFAGILTTAIFTMAAASASDLIPFFLGQQWEPSVALFRILALGGAAQGFSQISYWIFITEGKSRELLKYNIVTKLATVVAVAAATFVSVSGTAWAYSLTLLISWPINVLWIQRTANFPAREFLLNGFRTLIAGLIAALVTMSIPWQAFVSSQVVRMIMGVIVSGLIFTGLLAMTRGGRRDLSGLVKNLRKLI